MFVLKYSYYTKTIIKSAVNSNQTTEIMLNVMAFCHLRENLEINTIKI